MSSVATSAPRCPTPSRELSAAALSDLGADFEELLFVVGSAEAELEEAASELAGADLREQTRELLTLQLASSRRRYRSAGERLLELRGQAIHSSADPLRVDDLAAEKASLADLLRTEQALTAALVGAADWQSPSFRHSLEARAGRQDGRIRAHWNDYKRDRHLDADAYERSYVQAFVDGPHHLRALLTACGMAAFTTVLSFLRLEGALDGLVLAGLGLYHETRLLLARALPGRLHLVDEADTTMLLRSISRLRPSAVFLDSLSNTRQMPVPELRPVLERLAGTRTYVVVDNTGLSVSCQPFALAPDSVRLIVFESLLKYAQLGFDRANAGVIVARAGDADHLSDHREHLGTNVADVAVHALPRPNRQVLEKRLARLERNALLIAGSLDAEVGATVEVTYPGLPAHRSAVACRRLAFRGGCLSVGFRRREPTLRRERDFVEQAMEEARRRGVSLLAGSSFGFDTTRIYLTAEGAEYGEPFVRIAAGTEHLLEIERVAEALAAGIRAVGS